MALQTEIVAWCGECEAYEPESEIGHRCSGDHDYRAHVLVKRRMFICHSADCEGQGFFEAEDFITHMDDEHPTLIHVESPGGDFWVQGDRGKIVRMILRREIKESREWQRTKKVLEMSSSITSTT